MKAIHFIRNYTGSPLESDYGWSNDRVAKFAEAYHKEKIRSQDIPCCHPFEEVIGINVGMPYCKRCRTTLK